jgi:hypothetical protein
MLKVNLQLVTFNIQIIKNNKGCTLYRLSRIKKFNDSANRNFN